MTTDDAAAEPSPRRSILQSLLDGVEKVGNKVPHPVIMFLYLIAFVIVLSHILYLLDVSVTEEVVVPVPIPADPSYYGGSTAPDLVVPPGIYEEPEYTVRTETIPIQSLLTVEGIRYIFTSFVPNFAGFGVVAVIFVAMIGVGVAEQAGLMGALIRKLVQSAPRSLITFIIVLVGGLSSVATDAGYLILIPLGGAVFLSLNRHPLAGVVAAFGGVSVGFGVNVLITPLDGLLTEITNEAIQLAAPGDSLRITANLYFAIVSTLFVAVVVTVVTGRMIEPRLGTYNPALATPAEPGEGGNPGETATEQEEDVAAAESRGLRYALYGFLGSVVIIALLTVPPGAPLRRPETGAIDGNSPFMDSLIFIITLLFLAAGIGYGLGARTLKGSNDVINAVTKTFASLSSLIFLLLIISQFIGHFNYSNMPRVMAVALANVLEQLDIGAIPLLVGMIFVIFLLNFIIPGAMPKWAIFAPVFIPLFIQLGVAPQTVLAAYRVGDSPSNVITPLMVYFPFILLVAQRYQRDAGIGTIIALMLPYTVIVLVSWSVLFILWFALGIPLGPGSPVDVP